MRQKEVLLIIPAYNEEKNIEKVMKQLAQPEIADIVDVLVMNDASSDNTNWLAKEYGCAVVTHVFNLGYGSGLQLGYKYAIRRGYSYVIQMDADGQHDVCNIPKIYQRLKEKDDDGRTPDIVLGSRFMKGSTEFEVSFAKKMAFVLFRKMLYLATGRKIADPTTGLQGLSRKAVLYYSKYNHFDDKYPDTNMITINEQISNFAQTYPTNLKASSNEALLFMRRYRFANCSCFSCCFKDAYPSSNVQ